MNILVLNDMELVIYEPEDWYENVHDYTEDNFTQVLYQDQFEEALLSQSWDQVWLDHDLGVKNWNGKKATYLILEGVNVHEWDIQVGLFVVTSYNQYGAQRMLGDLLSGGFNAVAVHTDDIPGVRTNFKLFEPEGGFRHELTMY